MSFTDITAYKKELRRIFLDKRRALTRAEIENASADISKALLSLPEFERADTVLFFYPTRNEPELFIAMDEALKRGKSVAFPISRANTLTLDFRLVADLNELSQGTYGIYEPRESASTPILTESSLCVVPALSYDKQGFRLGYGKGYYDRFLPTFGGTSVGVAFDEFISPRLPALPTDIPVDVLITQTGVLKTK